ncbi:hypothetical protein Tco_1185093 [Tanacetum coccineum]
MKQYNKGPVSSAAKLVTLCRWNRPPRPVLQKAFLPFEDVEELYRLVKEKYSASRLEGYDLMLWGDLYTLFESDEEDEIWKNQHEYNLISWRLCDFCGIHILLMENGLAIHMLIEKKYPLSQELLSKMLSKKLEVGHESSQAFELLSHVIIDGHLHTPPSPNYVPGPEHPPSPDYVPGPEYPEYLVPSDDEVPIKDQPLPADASPTTLSSSYVAKFDPSEEDPEEDLTEYPANKGDNDEEEEESSRDDDKEEEDEAFEEEEEEEHLALADSTTLPAIDPVPSAEDTKAFEINESASMPPPPRSPRTKAPLGYKAIVIRSRAVSPPLLLPSTAYRDDIHEADTPLQKRAHFIAPTSRFEVRESSSAATARQAGRTIAHRVDYRFIDTMDASIRAYESRAMTAKEEVNDRVTDLATTQRQDAHEL